MQMGTSLFKPEARTSRAPADKFENLEKPASANRNEIIIAGKLHTDARRELLGKIEVARQFEIGVGIDDIDIVD